MTITRNPAYTAIQDLDKSPKFQSLTAKLAADGIDFIVTNDAEWKAKYFALRSETYTNGSSDRAASGAYRPDASCRDESSYFVIAKKGNDVIGGMRLQIEHGGAQQLLSFQTKEVFDTWTPILPSAPLEKLGRAQFTHLAVDKRYESQGIAKAIFYTAIDYCAKQHLDLFIGLPNEDNASKHIFMKTCNDLGVPWYDCGKVDLLTTSWKRPRNTKMIFVGALSPKLQELLDERIHNHITRWSPADDEENRITYASPLTRPKAVLFDWDKVFADHVPPYVSAFNYAFSAIKDEYGAEPNKALLRIEHSQAPEAYMKRIYRENDAIPALLREEIADKAWDIAKTYYDENLLANTPEIQGGVATLRLLKRLHIPFGIVSNSKIANLQPQIERLLGPEFSDVPYTGEAKKPETEALSRILQTLGVEPGKDVWVVGDTFHNDVTSALALGLHPVLFGARDIHHINQLRAEGRQGSVGFVNDHAELQCLIRGTRLSPPRHANLHSFHNL